MLNCITSVIFNTTHMVLSMQAWAETTVTVISQSLENYGLIDLYHSTGPPYSISIDLQSDLSTTMTMINEDVFTSDFIFQEHMQNLLQRTLDAHTRYQKPVCYNATFLQPFAFDVRVINGQSTSTATSTSLSAISDTTIKRKANKNGGSSTSDYMQVFIMKNIYTDIYASMYPDINIDSLINQEILLLNNIEFLTEISQWGDSHETKSNNRGVRFNAAIRSYLYRSVIGYSVNPIQDLIISLVNGTTVTLPWMAWYSSQLADVTACAKINHQMTTSSSDSDVSGSISTTTSVVNDNGIDLGASDRKHSALIIDSNLESKMNNEKSASSSQSASHSSSSSSSSSRSSLESSSAPHGEFITRKDRQIIIPSNNTYLLSCFIQSVIPTYNSTITKINNVLVMKVAGFAPPGNGYLDAWTHFLDNAKECLSTSYDMIVVDVIQNGGGYVCLGENI